MEKDCIDILKENMKSLVSSDQQEELDEIFRRELEIPPSGQFDISQDPDYITLETIFNEYMSEDDRKELGIE